METINHTLRKFIWFAKVAVILARKPPQIYPLFLFKTRRLDNWFWSDSRAIKSLGSGQTLNDSAKNRQRFVDLRCGVV